MHAKQEPAGPLSRAGDTRTLITGPASTTHRQFDQARQRAAGVLPRHFFQEDRP